MSIPKQILEAKIISDEEYKKIKEYERQINIKNGWCQRIIDISFDYDGYRNADNLMQLVDELREYAIKSINNDDKSIAYITASGKSENILMEEIQDN